MLGRRRKIERERSLEVEHVRQLESDELPASDPPAELRSTCPLHDWAMVFRPRFDGEPTPPEDLRRGLCPECQRLAKVRAEANERRLEVIEVDRYEMRLSERGRAALTAYEERQDANPMYVRPGSAEETDAIMRVNDLREEVREEENLTRAQRRRRHERAVIRGLWDG